MKLSLRLNRDLADVLIQAGSISERLTIACREYLAAYSGQQLPGANGHGYIDNESGVTSITWEVPADIANRIPRLGEREGQSHVIAAVKAYLKRYRLDGPAPTREQKLAPEPTVEVFFGIIDAEIGNMQSALGRKLRRQDLIDALCRHFVGRPTSADGAVRTLEYYNETGTRQITVWVPKRIAAQLSLSGQESGNQCRASLRAWFRAELRKKTGQRG